MNFYTEPFDRRCHVRDDFTSGEPSLDRWLKEFASQGVRQDTARVYVDAPDGRVLAYYALAMHSVAPETVAADARAGHPIPAVLITRLAVHADAQGDGRGRRLAVDALRRSALAADGVAARMVVVDALHDRASAFYEHLGFFRFASMPTRLYLPMRTVRTTLREGGVG